MKKNLFMGLALVSALAFVSCKSSESSYKQAYEKAKQQETYTQPTTATNTTVTTAQTTATTNVPVNANTRQENLTVVGNGALKAYNVVCGSFGSLQNAQNLRNTLINKGYSAQIAQNEKGMYRVIASSFQDMQSAIQSRNTLRAIYPDAWLLYKK